MGRRPPVVGGVLVAALVLAAAACTVASGSAGSAGSGGSGGSGGPGGAARPNVLVVVTDDARAETLQVMPKTRRWLAGGGVSFTHGFATTPSCCPSRASILSGRYVHNHGVLRQQLGDRLDQRTTLARYLSDGGYRTAMAGKFLNRWPLRRPPPHFDRYAQANGGYYDQLWQVDGALRRVPTYSSTFIGDRALAYLEEFEGDDARPWFLYLAPFAPHAPRVPEPRYARTGFPELERVGADPGGAAEVAGAPGYLRVRPPADPAEVAALRTGQARTLLSVDDLVDRVLRRLEDTGELDGTLVFYLSDNGYSWGEHRHVGKFVPYTESIKVPFLVRWPGRLPAGTVDDRLVATVDIKPTVLQAAGIRPDPGDTVDGRSLLDGRRRERLLAEYWRDQANAPGIRDWAALRSPAWQYVENYDQPGGGGTFREFYDLQRDPGMERNLLADGDPANDPPPTLAAELAAARACRGSSCP
jgi:arylsulfatase A-like enzyme